MPPEIDVTVMIVSFNTRDDVRECIGSVTKATTDASIEVVVVDNASVDGTAAMVAEEFPHVRLIANPDNRGFAAANNQAMAIARGRYVLLLNPDTVVLDGALDRSVAWADEHTDVAVLGCQILERPGEIQRTCFRFPTPYVVLVTTAGLTGAFPESRLFSGHNMPEWDRGSERDVDVVSGMFMLVRREAIDAVGVMDEAYFVYGEETDWCFRFRRAGWRCVFSPVGQVIHKEGGGRSTIQQRVQMCVQLQKSILIFMRKQQGRFAWLLSKMFYTASMFSRWALFTLMGLVLRREGMRARRAEAGAALRFHLTGGDAWRRVMEQQIENPPTTSAIDFTLLQDFAGAESLRTEWDALVERVDGDVFLTFDWCRTWWSFYGGGRSLYVFVARVAGQLVGVVPIAVERLWLGPIPLRVARLVGSDSTLSMCTPILAPDRAVDVLEHVFTAVVDDLGCDAISLGPASGASPARDMIQQAAARCADLVADRSEPSGLVHTLFELPETFEDYLAGLHKKVRGTYRRDLKKLATEGEVRVERVSDPAAAGPAFDAFLAAHVEQWRAVGNGGHFHDWPDSEAFHRELIQSQGQLGRVRFTRVLVGDRVAVSHYGYTLGTRYLWFMPGRLSGAKWDGYGLGRIGLVSDIQARIAEGVRVVEGGRGHYDYKTRLGAIDHPMETNLLVSRRGSAGMRLAAFGRLARLLNYVYYRGWYVRGSRRLGVVPGPLKKTWIRTRL